MGIIKALTRLPVENQVEISIDHFWTDEEGILFNVKITGVKSKPMKVHMTLTKDATLAMFALEHDCDRN